MVLGVLVPRLRKNSDQKKNKGVSEHLFFFFFFFFLRSNNANMCHFGLYGFVSCIHMQCRVSRGRRRRRPPLFRSIKKLERMDAPEYKVALGPRRM